GILRAIGDPDKRFKEDALRILRALRFSAVYNLKIEENTSEALLRNRERLNFVSKERIMREITKIVKAPFCEDILLQYKAVIFVAIPELAPCDGVFQRQDYHCYDVWEHIVHSVGAIEPRTHLRLTMLLHDVGKPLCSDGRGHFKGHAYKSADITFDILKRMNVSAKLREKIVKLVRLHNTVVENSDEAVRRLLYKVGTDSALDLIKVFRADNTAKRSEIALARNKYYTEIEERIEILLKENPPLTLRNLKLGGQDIIALGVAPGPDVGKVLKALNQMAAENLVKNERSSLLAASKKIITENHIKTHK
ncbi:MAG: HD domain-containing protein, partial [Oscillospiraceae bacterium]